MVVKTGINWNTPGLDKGSEWTAYSGVVLIAKIVPVDHGAMRWYWACFLPRVYASDPFNGYTETANAAKAKIEKLWLTWLKAAGLHTTKTEPVYGDLDESRKMFQG